MTSENREKSSSKGAAVVPFCINQGKVLFLFHKTFSGRRRGLLVDFGGGSEQGEKHHQTAIREFVEETEAMFLSANPSETALTESSRRAQSDLMKHIFDQTLTEHPQWWCTRKAPSGKTKDWKTFFIELPFKEVTVMNTEWKMDDGKRFTKRRELLWVTSDHLKLIVKNEPHKLWKRIRQLQGMEEVIDSIIDAKLRGSTSNQDTGRSVVA